MDALFDDVPTQRKGAAATGRRGGSSRNPDYDVTPLDTTPVSARREMGSTFGLTATASMGRMESDLPQAPPASAGLDNADLSNSWDDEGDEKPVQLASTTPAAQAPNPSVGAAGTRKPVKTLFDEDDSVEPQTQRVFDGTSRRKQLELQKDASGAGAGHGQKYAVEKELVLDDVPEMTDAGNEDITRVVADAPKLHATRHVQSLGELEDPGLGRLKHMLQGQTAIDLSLLTQCLIPQELSVDPDVFWDEDILLTEVASDLQREREERERFAMELVA